MHKIIYSEYK